MTEDHVDTPIHLLSFLYEHGDGSHVSSLER